MANENEVRDAVTVLKQFGEELGQPGQALLSLAEEWLAVGKGLDLEVFADIEHTRWSGWQAYLHSKCVANPDGSLTIPAGYVKNLERLINTPYEKLTEQEKESDRDEARKGLSACRIAVAKYYVPKERLLTEEEITKALLKKFSTETATPTPFTKSVVSCVLAAQQSKIEEGKNTEPNTDWRWS